MRGIKLFIAFLKMPNLILTKNTIQKHYLVDKGSFWNF
jgi:hypothetical protein